MSTRTTPQRPHRLGAGARDAGAQRGEVERGGIPNRSRVVLAVMLTILVVFAARLMSLQLASGERYNELSTQNFTHTVRIAPLRGRILARDGTVLADDRIAYDLMYTGGAIEGWDRLALLLDLQGEPHAPDPTIPEEARDGAVLAWNIPDALTAAVEERVAGQPNLYLRERVERTYPTNLAAQVVGYTTLADPERLPDHAPTDMAGAMGIEASYEAQLYGTPGQKMVESDNRGTVLSESVLTPPGPGRDLVLTIDPALQRLAEDVLAGSLTYVNEQRARDDLPPDGAVRGALLALDPRSGEILAMASAPSFDQNVFTRRPSDPAQVEAILTDGTNLPLSNRAFEAFPPASTFKLVTSLTLLEQGYVQPGTSYNCAASIQFGGIRWRNWSYPISRGSQDLVEAIADSCNTYFWQAVLDTPDARSGWAPFIAAMTQRARDLGFGRPVGIGLDNEKSGRVPDDAWSRAYHGWPWRPGDSLNVSIGQGDTLATPVQDALLAATVAMDGLQVQPHLVRAVGGAPVEVPKKQIESRYWGVLRDGMRHMVTDHGSNRYLGSGSGLPVSVAGKSGTAQNARGDGYDHVWFTGFAPVEDPEIVVVVFIQNGNKSTEVAVPTARDFLLGYFANRAEAAAAAP